MSTSSKESLLKIHKKLIPIVVKVLNTSRIINKLVFTHVRNLNRFGGGHIVPALHRYRSYPWSEVINLPHVMVSYGYLAQLKQYFSENAVSNNCEIKSFRNAIDTNNIDILRYLLDDLQIDIRKTKGKRSRYNVTKILNHAAKSGRLEIVRYLCEQTPFKWNYYEAMVKSPLSRDFEIVKYLVERVNSSKLFINYSSYNSTVFDNAAKIGGIDMIKWLSSNRSADKKTSNMLLSAVNAKQAATIEYLLREGKETMIPLEVIEAAIKVKSMEILQLLSTKSGYYGVTAYELAINTGSLEIVKFVHARTTARPSTPYEKAALIGSLDIVKWLFENQISVCNPAAFDCACYSGNMELVNYLFDKVAMERTKFAVQNAIIKGNLELVKLLSAPLHDHFEGAINLTAEKGQLSILKWLNENRTDLLFTPEAMDLAVKNNHFNVARWLHLNRTEGCSSKAIDYAARHGYLDVVQFLNENYSNGFSDDAILSAIENGYLDVVQYLCDNTKAKIPKKALFKAVFNGYTDIVKYLYSKTQTDEADSLMNVAAERGHMEILMWLDEMGETCTTGAMDNAAGSNQIQILRWLHENRSEGCTHFAMEKALFDTDSSLEVVEWLYNNRTECKDLSKIHISVLADKLSRNQFDIIEWVLEKLDVSLEFLELLHSGKARYTESIEVIERHIKLLNQNQNQNQNPKQKSIYNC
ncbi:hypothetical protein PPL_02010 [Heterostelium album PN500]|uniref:Ankyrin repeat protein n=1 Tax=Heterostelium pallidum (strain ATCC 26659 / Pp 5 / PN500) TaxID=670386 RepID=D3B141_HETP5|nr:hypothetical protein PPL_02010 [Heterostelium album PN500]EFA85015.1 hypothetical protein PPL_02010 [Heterostelium album PN500]|eukprot:XP_020437125.1 hypothetical protein PPL_02010 [Heterostelium album PN500]